jgi:glutathione synthase/RimK-type ligase-like ATP-grasp enzyme
MKRICFLSCQSLKGLVNDDGLVITELKKNGEYQVTEIPWDNEADWASFDLAVVRTTWDYVPRFQEFLKKLEFIASQTKLLNSLEVIQWNYHKGYLKELESRGVNIVPTVMFAFPGEIKIPSQWKEERFIVKPAISATAFKTMIVSREDLTKESFLAELFPGDWMLQPFLEEIKQGEVSLHFFGKKFSHGIIKLPRPGDFRVQEEHGGSIQEFTPDQGLLDFSDHLLAQVPFDLLLARVDVVKWKNEYVLMELELIEPALSFRTSSQSVRSFKAALDKIFKLA